MENLSIYHERVRELDRVRDSIKANYGIRFVVEKVESNSSILYYLKRRKTTWSLKKNKYTDIYELNGLNKKMIFYSIDEIISYLKLMFSQREGFIYSREELN